MNSDVATVDTLRSSELPKCPWAHVAASPPKTDSSFSDIMSEQLAEGLQTEETEKYFNDIIKSTPIPNNAFRLPLGLDLDKLMNESTGDCSSDEVIANMLQLQFNKEHDNGLRKIEQKYNGSSKVSVSLSNYMASPVSQDSDSDEEEEEFRRSKKPWDSFEAHEKAFPTMSGRGYVKMKNEVVTKHDVTMSGRRNACRVMESLPPCIDTGDAGSFDMQLSNSVYNSLKTYSKAEEQRRTRLHDKSDKATTDMAVDPKTRLLLYKLISADILKNVDGIVSTGKESVILYAEGGGKVKMENGETIDVPQETAIKAFKTTLNEFKTRDKYIRDDYRFKERFSKQNPRKVIHMWAEKEMHNLNRMSKAGIPCPDVVLLKKHLLLLSFVGENGAAAPKLKEVTFPDDDNDFLLRTAYQQTIDGMRKLYMECHLVHADLSEYNILWHKNTCVFIDVSQSVEPTHPNALEFLYRDCHNIITFFGKRRLEGIHSAENLFTYVSQLELKEGEGPSVIGQLRDFEKNMELLTFDQSEKTFPFETMWAQETD